MDASTEERDRLLAEAMQSNEELDRMVHDLRDQRGQLAEDLEQALRERDEASEQSANTIGALSTRAKSAAAKLEELQHRQQALEDQLNSSIAERKQAEDYAQTICKDNMAMRVDYGVRAKLLEDNIEALTAHIDELEKIMRTRNVPVPRYLNVASTFETHREARQTTRRRPSIVSLQSDKRDAG